MMRLRAGKCRASGSAPADDLLKRCIFRRKKDVDARADDGNGGGRAGTIVRGCVNTASQAGHDDKAGIGKAVGEFAREPVGRCRGIACTDQRDATPAGERRVATQDQRRWRSRRLRQQRRIVGLAQETIARAELCHACGLRLDSAHIGWPEARCAAPACGEVRQSLKRPCC